ncbi:MAG TPA: 3-hydroxylacyl-ACP dehydratase [Accumulibacter sp.]|jgi:predicted hotdog family 3-hydroxylacyl-ACP dehydratase|nr:3-hydroxylacyl-ACP dehydratase [Accumulibacter sp.]HPP47448.1 3-hydroxylacyl-ACP dehydratase [Accumulibacter sp.]
MLDRDWIAAHIPHQGSMCLLDAVLDWSPTRIRCRARQPGAADHPLRLASRLGAACGIEYAAQAMAVHGALLAGNDDPPRQGYLTSVRAVTLHVDRLDDLPGDLTISADCLGGESNVLYRFAVHHGADCLLEGRAAVVLDAQSFGG